MKRLLLFGALTASLTLGMAQDQRPAPEKSFPSLIQLDQAVSRTQAQSIFKDYFKMTGDDVMRLTKTETDELGFTHDKFQQYYKGLKVDGAIYTVHSKGGEIKTMSGVYLDIRNVDVTPSISESAALAYAKGKVNAQVYAWEDAVKAGYPGYNKPQGELVIFAYPNVKETFSLAYKFDIYAAEPLYRAWVYVDAKTGKVLMENSRIHETNVSSTANTLYNGNRSITADYTGSNYRLRQTVSGGGIQTFSLHNGTNYGSATDITSSTSNFTGDQTANQAHWGAERTYDYYLIQHNRNSFNNSGGIIKSYVHYSNNYVNAFWDGSRMTYGDGNGTSYGPLVSLDICGHEISHGVTEYSANLVYQNQSGALNESFSDIFGEAIESYSLGSNDWLMGNDIGIGGSGAIRSMSNPNQFGDPDTYGGTYWYTGSADYGGVHTNSGVQNKWFYILAAGESGTNDIGSSYSVSGIGITKAAKIAYRNLTVYLTSSSAYSNARAGAIQAAIDLYGAGSAEEIATTNAWYAVGVGGAYCAGCISYCTSAGSNYSYEWIKTVTIGSFTNNSGAAGYSDFTGQTINLVAGSNNNVSLVPGFSGSTYNEYWKIWIDFNKDGDFTDAGEQLFAAGPSTSAVSGSIAIPGTVTGTTRMRISMKYNTAPGSSCETFTYGEVEDYTVTFSGAGPDTQPPSAPALSSTGSTATTISLSWTAATDNVGVSGYEVYVNGALKTTTTSLSYTVTGLTASTTYSIYVRAKDAAGNGTNSNTISVATQSAGDTQPPTAPVLSSTGSTTTTIGLSWTASSDNVGVTGYEVYVNGSLKTTTTSLSYTVTGLTASTTYSIYVRAKDAAGNGTNSNTISVTTPGGGGGPTTIFAHYFETGWDGWIDGGSDCGRYGGSRSYEGNYSIYIRDNSGTSSAMTSSAYNVSAYNQLVIDFYFYAYSMENGEDFWVRYYNGSSWSTVASFVSGSSFSGNGFYHATVTLNTVNFPTNAQFRFQCDASANSDLIYIDQVTLTGSNSGTLRGPANTQTCDLVSSAPQGFGADELTRSLVIYPNPAASSITVQTDAVVKSVRIFSINGALVKRFATFNSSNKLDVSGLRVGLYLAVFETDGGNITRKFLKR